MRSSLFVFTDKSFLSEFDFSLRSNGHRQFGGWGTSLRSGHGMVSMSPIKWQT